MTEPTVLSFTTLVDRTGLARHDVRLLRHKDGRYPGFPSIYALWRDHRPRFDAYQETQAFGDEPDLRAPFWASFVGLPGSTETLFVGMNRAELVGPLPADRPHPITCASKPAGSCRAAVKARHSTDKQKPASSGDHIEACRTLRSLVGGVTVHIDEQVN